MDASGESAKGRGQLQTRAGDGIRPAWPVWKNPRPSCNSGSACWVSVARFKRTRDISGSTAIMADRHVKTNRSFGSVRMQGERGLVHSASLDNIA